MIFQYMPTMYNDNIGITVVSITTDLCHFCVGKISCRTLMEFEKENPKGQNRMSKEMVTTTSWNPTSRWESGNELSQKRK